MAPWPFGTDADRDDPLTALRIPVVDSCYPRWRYVAAYLKPQPDEPYATSSAERPTDIEARMLASYIEQYLDYFFHDSYRRRLAERPLDADSGCNTVIFIKYGPDDWGYRRCSWTHGPMFVPEPPTIADRAPGPLSLVQVMDRIHAGGERPSPFWSAWKAGHPDTFPPQPTT